MISKRVRRFRPTSPRSSNGCDTMWSSCSPTTKIHVVDAQGLPIRLGLTAGQTHDGQMAKRLLDHLGPHTIVLADKAYDPDRI